MARLAPRLLLPILALAALLTLAAPAHADGSPGQLRDLPDALSHWIASLWQTIGWHIDPDGVNTPEEGGQGDIGLHIDPNGVNTPEEGGQGEISWGIDPNG